MGEGRSTFIPNFISASTPQGLRRLMLKNNFKKGIQFFYFDIQFVKGKWVAWYRQDIKTKDDMKELMGVENGGN